MTSRLWRNLAITIAVTLFCLYGVIGIPSSYDDLKANLAENIKLGLDLKGGTHLILQVQVQDAVRAEADRVIARLEADLQSAGVGYQSLTRNDPETIEEADSITITAEGVPPEGNSILRDAVEIGLGNEWIMNSTSSNTVELTMRPAALAALKAQAVTQSISTIGNRINGLGLTEPVIQQHGRADAEHEILVQLPGVSDPARVMDLLQMSAQLSIQKVLDGPYPSRQTAIAQRSGVMPPNSELLPFGGRDVNGQLLEQWYVLERTPAITGRDLRNATPRRNPEDGQWEAGFSLSREAGARFGNFTQANIQNPIATVLDNRIINVATVQNRIESEGRITGLGQTEATDLALVLRAGALPASVVYLEERTVGASLGADSIRQGVQSALYGVVIIVLTMLIYYKRSGVNAVLALFLNLIILLAVLSYLGFVLTLPGIAGIVLTIGMAVDANVLIFERIREELRAGKGVVGALNAGFGKAVLTIVDTNFTTIIAAAFLFLFGEGPIQGFAITLGVGLMANLFTSVFVSRLIFDMGLSGKKKVEELSI